MIIEKEIITSNPRFKDTIVKHISVLIMREIRLKIFYKELLKEEDIKMNFLLNQENILKIRQGENDLTKIRDIKTILILLNNVNFLKELQEYKQTINQGE